MSKFVVGGTKISDIILSWMGNLKNICNIVHNRYSVAPQPTVHRHLKGLTQRTELCIIKRTSATPLQDIFALRAKFYADHYTLISYVNHTEMWLIGYFSHKCFFLKSWAAFQSAILRKLLSKVKMLHIQTLNDFNLKLFVVLTCLEEDACSAHLNQLYKKKCFTQSKVSLRLFGFIWLFSFLKVATIAAFKKKNVIAVPVDLSPEERSELEDIRRRKGVLLQEIQRLREELREAILEVEGLEASTEGR